MDLKGIGKPIGPLPALNRERVERSINSERTLDRDGNGQASFGGDNAKQQSMSDEEFKRAVEHLKSLQVVKDHQLEVLEYEKEGKKFVLLREPSGKVIRRISESELWTLQIVKDHEKGQLLSKAA